MNGRAPGASAMEAQTEQATALFLDWEEAFAAGAASAGGKGWNLGRLVRYGFRVPAGGVLASKAYGFFLEHNRLDAAVAEVSAAVTLENATDPGVAVQLAGLRAKIAGGCIPPVLRDELLRALSDLGIAGKPLAVRSSMGAEDSAGASFAGMHDSFLNVRGEERLWDAVKGCYASLWTPRAVAYRRKMGIGDGEVVPAVVVMEMAEARAAGIAFSCDPRTGREDRLLVDANFGLGESVVAGRADPDEYVLKITLESPIPRVLEKKVGAKGEMTVLHPEGGTQLRSVPQNGTRQALHDGEIARLGLLVLRVLAALGEWEEHQDIEWAYDGNDFVLLQARPVTALPRHTYPQLKSHPDIWSNGNFRDSIPGVLSPLCWGMMKVGLSALLEEPHRTAGFSILPGVRHVRRFRGRAYQNMTTLQWAWFDGFGVTPREISESTGGHQPELAIDVRRPYRGWRGLHRAGRMLSLMKAVSSAAEAAPRWISRVGGITSASMRQDLALTGRELVRMWGELGQLCAEFAPVFMLVAGTGAVPRLRLVRALEKHFPQRGVSLANALLAGGGCITSAEHGYRLTALAETARSEAAARTFFAAEPFRPLLWAKVLPPTSAFRSEFQTFLAEFGHRGIYELDIANPRWREDPSWLLHTIRDTLSTADLAAVRTRQRETAERSWTEVEGRAGARGVRRIRALVRKAVRGAELREMSKSVFVQMNAPLRRLALEAGRRLAVRGILDDPDDVFFCYPPELFALLLDEWDGRGMKTLVAERKEHHRKWVAEPAPDLIVDEHPQYVCAVPDRSGKALSGVGVAAGRGRGKAAVVRHPEEGTKLGHGDVLVAPSTDPAWTPLFLRASGIVMETGGHLSHGAIVAREYGIPAVVNIPGVLEVIRDRREVVVDGDEGRVYLS